MNLNIRNLYFTVRTKLYFKPKKRWLVWGTIIGIITEEPAKYWLVRNNKHFKELRSNVHLWVGEGLLKVKK